MERNLTTGSVLKNILYFSLPYLLSYFLQTLYGMADLFIVGQFDGVASTTAVSVGSQVMHMITVMLVGLAMGTTVTIGQAVGAGNREKASKTVGNTVVLFMVLSVVLMAVLLFFVKTLSKIRLCVLRKNQDISFLWSLWDLIQRKYTHKAFQRVCLRMYNLKCIEALRDLKMLKLCVLHMQ